jgi:hypothetical protein
MESINNNQIKLKIKQLNNPYHLITSVKFITTDSHIYKTIEIKEKERDYIFDLNEVISAEINILRDYPLISESYYTWSNIFDNWKSAKIVYGTTQQIEANHTLATRFSTAIADRFTEDLIPVIKESELTNEDLKNCDLILLGSSEDNNIIRSLAEIPGLELYKNSFKWNDKIYSRSDEGVFLSLPNPYNPSKAVYLFISNSAPELYQMTKLINRIPQWGVFRGDKIIEKGYYNQMTILR